jgi:hypothetical protein
LANIDSPFWLWIKASWDDTLFAVTALSVATPFYIVMNLILSRTILQDPSSSQVASSQSPRRLLLYVVLWFAVSQACVPMFGYCFGIAYDDLDFEIPILFVSSLFFQTLLFLFLRMSGERLIAIESPAENT